MALRIVNNLKKNQCIKGSDVMIILLEPSLENRGIRDGNPASEVKFHF
jgi:hypothetical protein